MKYADMIAWLENWCIENSCQLSLHGFVGFNRPCVGVLRDGQYPSYQWESGEFEYEGLDDDASCIPSKAYHKYPCIAVLGHEIESVEQLYNWLKWFNDNGYELKVGDDHNDELFKKYVRMVKKVEIQ